MEQQDFQDVELVMEDRVARITLNRPEKLNAIRIKTYKELITAFKSADQSPQCHVIVVQGAGGRFTAGNDLADLVNAEKHEVMEGVQGIFDTVAGLKKVVVAAVEGVAVGIGTTLLLHCDIAVCSSNTKFRLPFANLGVSPEGAASALLPRAVGEKAASELLLTGRFFSADEAMGWGLVNAIAEPDQMAARVEEYVGLLLQQPLQSLMATKDLMRRARGNVSGVVTEELQVFERLLTSDATRGRIKSLLK
ncbi:MAG: enoyl-CoA hydratase/isomerase family protein [Desulfopila sp.]